ncbi:MAG: SCO family protein [Acetobacteraceae bacterium]
MLPLVERSNFAPMNASFVLPRRAALLSAAALAFARSARATPASAVNIGGVLPTLSFTMQRSSDRHTVSAADYRGKVVVLYFGFTRCPDICPLTMQNAARVLVGLGPLASDVRVLFATIDLAYDTLPRLKSYLAQFAPPPEIDGLRGTPRELAELAHRYAVAFQAPSSPDASDPVSTITHTSAVYLFDAQGQVEQIVPALGAANADIRAITADLETFVRRT